MSILTGSHYSAYNAGQKSIIIKSLEKDKVRAEKNDKGEQAVQSSYKGLYKTLPNTSTYKCSPHLRAVIERLPIGLGTKPTY